MTLSMTGFSRKDSSAPWGELALEIRSVNHRYLEMSIRLPEEFRSLDPEIRRLAGSQLSRGKLDISVKFTAQAAQQNDINLNHELVNMLINTGQQLSEKLNGGQLSPRDILRWPGVVLEPEKDLEAIHKTAMLLLNEALSDLIASRASEGARLAQMLLERCTEITSLVKQVRVRLPEVRAMIQSKLRARLETLQVDADEGRLETEIALMLNKADVDEELDRLDSHVTEARNILATEGPIGRRLDFLMQEFNREANTLSSKSQDAQTTKVAMELKVLIEQMREQVQNIE